MTGRPRKFDWDGAALMRSQGLTYRAIAEACGVTIGAVRRVLTPEQTATARQREILARLASGQSTFEVAEALWITWPTVRYHLRCAYRRLGVHSRREAIALAREQGWLA